MAEQQRPCPCGQPGAHRHPTPVDDASMSDFWDRARPETGFRPPHLSVSSVELYARCPAQWKARYVDKLPSAQSPEMAFGAVIGKALEALHSGHDAELVLAQTHAQSAVRPVRDVDYALRLLNLYRELGLCDVVGVPEQRFLLHLPDRTRVPVPILGYLDLELEDRVREIKTSRAKWTEMRAQAAHQTHVYGWAFQQRKHRRPVCVEYVIFNTMRPDILTLNVEPNADGLRLFELAAAATWSGIVAGRFACTCKTGTGRAPTARTAL